jgi:hypothetical protein
MSRGGGDTSLAVVVYGSDGKAYGSPAAARAAGVENFTMSPPVDRSKDTNSLPKELIDSLPQQFESTAQQQGKGYTSYTLNPPPNAEAKYERGGMGMNTLTGYQIPLQMPANYPKTDARGFPVPPLVANYDPTGKLTSISAKERYWADNQVHILPEYSPTGKFITATPATNEQAGSGGLGGFISDVAKDYGPMILAGLGANYLGGSGLLGGGAAAGSGALSPYAAQAAGAYGGSAAAASAAAAGNLAGIQAASAAQNALTQQALSNTGLTFGGDVPTATPDQVFRQDVNQVADLPPEVATETTASASDIAANDALAQANRIAQAAGGFTPSATTGLLSSLGSIGSSALDFAKANPSLTGSLLGAGVSALGALNAPKEQTTTSSIDPQIRAEYLANLERAKTTAAGLEARQIAQPGAMYTGAEQQLYNLGMTPFGATDIARFYNPYQEQVVQGALSDIERARLMQEQANMASATNARAFGGSRQGVVSGMTNEAALRQAATTGAQLRSAGFTQAANLGLAARPMDVAGLQTSLGLGTTRTALEQARLDALRNLGTERLQMTSGALGIGIPNLGSSSTQPLYSSTTGSALSGGLTGAYIGSLLGKG